MGKKLRKYLISTFVFIVAIIILFEEWVWDRLKPFLEYFSRFRIIRRIEIWVSGTNAYLSLSLFLIPFVLTHIIEI